MSSPAHTIKGIIACAEATDQAWGPLMAMALPALTTTPAKMATALERVAGKHVAELIDWKVDSAINNIVKTWPVRVNAARAKTLGLLPETSFEDIVREYVRENPDAIRRPAN